MAMSKKPARVLSVAGSDPGGGAGIQADVKTVTVLGGFGMSVVTAITVQNTLGVQDIYCLPPDLVARQFDAVATDIGIDAVKTGMLPNREIMAVVVGKIRKYGLTKVVVDPVLAAKRGEVLMSSDTITLLIEELLPQVLVVTPNIPEAEILSGIIIASREDMRKAALIIYRTGVKNVVIKGGHLPGMREESLDILYDGDNFYEFSSPRIDTKDTHGTGCTYASALATFLAGGSSIREAVAGAKNYVTAAIRHAWRLGGGQGPVNHLAFLLLEERAGRINKRQ
jgi:hydroxymethylpyrimidine/phosphomethylpyrimidine kinase